MEQNHKLSSDTRDPLVYASQYRCLIGRFFYLTITRPDIMYLVHILRQFIQDPCQGHSEATL